MHMTPEEYQYGDTIEVHYDSGQVYTGMYIETNADREDRQYIRVICRGKLFPMRLWTYKTRSIDWISRPIDSFIKELSSI